MIDIIYIWSAGIFIETYLVIFFICKSITDAIWRVAVRGWVSEPAFCLIFVLFSYVYIVLCS